MNHTPTLLNDSISDGFWMDCDCGWSSFTDDDPGVVVTEFDIHVDECLDDCDPHGIPRPILETTKQEAYT